MGSSFFVRGMFNIRLLESTMSHVMLYWLPLRKPVWIARSNSGRCEAHVASMAFRSLFLIFREEANAIIILATVRDGTCRI